MDGLRKVPDNVPNQDMLAEHLGRPLTTIPDPFGTHESFGAHNNARLRAFLDTFGFEYKFASATDYYRGGRFDAALLRDAGAPRRREEVDPADAGPGTARHLLARSCRSIRETGLVMQVPMEGCDPAEAPSSGRSRDGRRRDPVTGGHCKAQWKADWALRWSALGVDYEMSGKDLIDSVELSSRICRVLGGTPPRRLHL